MKKLALILVAVMMVGFTAWSAFGAITNSAHDLSGAFGTQQQICVFCHAPHNAAVPTAGPLWNHTETVATYTMYPGTAPGSVIDGTIGAEPGGTSKLCLSCHDGTVAIDAYGGSAGTESMGTYNPTALLDTDLTNDHPISITYTTATALADGELNDPANYILGGTQIVNRLDNNQIQCSTCHDVHNGGAAELVNQKLLYETTDGSAICLACHAK